MDYLEFIQGFVNFIRVGRRYTWRLPGIDIFPSKDDYEMEVIR